MEPFFSRKFLFFGGALGLEPALLEIEKCDQLNEVAILEQALPKLQKLIIRNCQSLAMVHMTKKMVSQMEEVCVPPDCTRIIEEWETLWLKHLCGKLSTNKNIIVIFSYTILPWLHIFFNCLIYIYIYIYSGVSQHSNKMVGWNLSNIFVML